MAELQNRLDDAEAKLHIATAETELHRQTSKVYIGMVWTWGVDMGCGHWVWTWGVDMGGHGMWTWGVDMGCRPWDIMAYGPWRLGHAICFAGI